MTNTRNWAVVVGIDKYWIPPACLSGAVRDALRMSEWLLDESGGGVEPTNLFLLLSPTEPDALLDCIHDFKPATHENIISAITNLVQQSRGEGDRLFFHFAGHGLATSIDFADEDVLVPEDFTPDFPFRSLGLNSILEYLKSTQLRDQFFFIDACRDIPSGRFRIGYMSAPEAPDRSHPAVQQFVFYATSPGRVALEDGSAGAEQGAFTQTLLDGLCGKGKAKVWDSVNAKYLVRVDRLFDYLVSEMSSRKTSIDGADWFQIPRLAGERGALSGSNPVLAQFSEDAIANESLQILMEPFTVELRAAVAVQREQFTIVEQDPVAQVPIIFELPPKEYTVYARATDYEPEEARCSVELYDPQSITIRLVSKRPSTEGELPGESVPLASSVAQPDQVIPEPAVTPKESVSLQISNGEIESVPEPSVTASEVVSTRTRKSRRQRPNWKETLRFLLDKSKHLVGRYREVVHKTDLTKLERGIALGEEALLNEDESKGERAVNKLQDAFRKAHADTRLCIAHLQDHESLWVLTQKLAKTVERLRKAYRTNNRIAIDELSAALDLILAQILLAQFFKKNYASGLVAEALAALQRFSPFLAHARSEHLKALDPLDESGQFFKGNLSLRKPLPTQVRLAQFLKKNYVSSEVLLGKDRRESRDFSAFLEQVRFEYLRDLDPLNRMGQYLNVELLRDFPEDALAKEQVSAQRFFRVKAQFTLRVITQDPVAPLELASSAGQILRIGQGTIVCEHLEPGFYRARVVLPEGQVSEKLVEVSNRVETIVLDSPRLLHTRLLRDMLTDGPTRNDRMVRQHANNRFSTQVSTLLLLSAAATIVPTATSGLKVFFGIESGAHGRVLDYRWRFWSQQQKMAEVPSEAVEPSSRDELGEFSCTARPGDYWLAIQAQKRKPNVFALKLLPHRVTVLIFHINRRGEGRVLQYLLPDASTTIDAEQLRRLDLMQRFYLSGRIDHAYELAKTLVNSKVSEPTALCLSGYLLLKLGKSYEAGRVAQQVIEVFNELSDGYVLLSEWQANKGDLAAAADACRAALDRGFPVFATGLSYLFYRVRNHRIEHKRRNLLEEMFKYRVRALMWSAWTPEVVSNASFALKETLN